MKAAVIGIGSNSVRCLLAETGEDGFTCLWRDREGTRLFAGLDERGNLSRESMDKTVAAVARMASEVRHQRAEKLGVFATSAARDAANGEEFIRAVAEAAETEPQILPGNEEAELSFLGASAAVKDERCGVVDIGGGSTEFAIGTREGIEASFSCQMGAVRLYQKLRIDRKEDMIPVQRAAGEILKEHLGAFDGIEIPKTWVGTGGTFTTLAAMARGVSWTDRTNMHGTEIARWEIQEIGEKLAEMSLEERKQLPGLQPGRADIVVHGICILLGVMDQLKITKIIVSEWGNLDGYIRKFYC
ncbi:MAG: Ppx/GppA family phosphatase [Clostridia bacterium]|jgi:exopolyphosphatase/guanosine-5'-triphosphate,3'-diphosphate pyrophosphatase|nr:Ppx/GppA family phosphatase [Clostridia bacterium]